VAALVPLVDSLVADSLPALHGTVYPAGGGGTVSIQASDHGGWRTVATGGVGADGSYSVEVPAAGTYRIVYDGISGPSISVS
jgi:hypothetical protein